MKRAVERKFFLFVSQAIINRVPSIPFCPSLVLNLHHCLCFPPFGFSRFVVLIGLGVCVLGFVLVFCAWCFVFSVLCLVFCAWCCVFCLAFLFDVPSVFCGVFVTSVPV